MGPEKPKQEQDPKPVARPFEEDQTGISQPNQSIWGEGEAGEVLRPPPDAVPGRAPDRSSPPKR